MVFKSRRSGGLSRFVWLENRKDARFLERYAAFKAQENPGFSANFSEPQPIILRLKTAEG